MIVFYIKEIMVKMGEIEIMGTEKGDFSELIDVYQETIIDTFKKEGIYKNCEDEIPIEVEKLKAILRNYLEKRGDEIVFLTARLQGKIIGMIYYNRISTNYLIKDCIDIDFSLIPEVGGVYIHQNYHKIGVGKELFKSIILHMKQNDVKEFCLDCGFKKSQNFFKKLLGPPSKIRKDYWSKGNDHLIWIKQTKDFL